MKNLLTIVIPTYCRPNILKYNLSSIIDNCKKNNILIKIFDDSDDNKTHKVFTSFSQKYKNIKYKKNYPSLGHDLNIVNSLRSSLESEYVWLLGDSIEIDFVYLTEIINLLSTRKHDILSFSVKNRLISYPSGEYIYCNEVLSKFGWHLPLTGATIYSYKVIQMIDEFDTNHCRNFPQFNLIYQFLSIKCSFYWLNKKVISLSIKRNSYWINDIFSVFIDDWPNAIRSLPKCYRNEIKDKLIIDHSIKSGIFSFKSLLHLRSLKIYNLKIYKNYSEKLSLHSNLSKTILFFIAIIPSLMNLNSYKIFKSFKNLLYFYD